MSAKRGQASPRSTPVESFVARLPPASASPAPVLILYCTKQNNHVCVYTLQRVSEARVREANSYKYSYRRVYKVGASLPEAGGWRCRAQTPALYQAGTNLAPFCIVHSCSHVLDFTICSKELKGKVRNEQLWLDGHVKLRWRIEWARLAEDAEMHKKKRRVAGVGGGGGGSSRRR